MMTAQSKGRRLAESNPGPTVLACLILLAALSLAFWLSAMLATTGREDRPPQEATAPAATLNRIFDILLEDKPPEAVASSSPGAAPPSTAPAETPEPVRHRDDIVSDGRLLAYELQEIMQDCCETYNVPYALALAIAEVETHFDPDAVSPTHDYGLMQINRCNHEWLQSLGMDPLTHAGNIEAGLYMIGSYLSRYGDTEMALMAYNNGPGGARKLWDAGTYQTNYTRKVMTALEYWTSILED